MKHQPITDDDRLCQHCDGKGMISEKNYWSGTTTSWVCDYCRGTGRYVLAGRERAA